MMSERGKYSVDIGRNGVDEAIRLRAFAQSRLNERLGMTARQEIGHWLNELPNRNVDRGALAELCADYDALEAALRWHIRVYRVADEAWEPEAEIDRLMKLALSKVPNELT